MFNNCSNNIRNSKVSVVLGSLYRHTPPFAHKNTNLDALVLTHTHVHVSKVSLLRTAMSSAAPRQFSAAAISKRKTEMYLFALIRDLPPLPPEAL